MRFILFRRRAGRSVLRFSTLAAIASAAGELRAAPDPDAVMAKVVRDLDLQTRMPGPEAPDPPIHWSDTHWHIPGTVAEWVMWGAVVVGLAFALYAMRDTMIPRRSRQAKPRRPGAVILPLPEAVARMTEAGDDADELARLGRFAEAMHVLLLRSLAEMRKSLDVTIADSLTSREVLRRIKLPDTGRTALADLIARVEPVHFGRGAAASADYGACRTSFDRLVDAMRTVPA